MPMMFHIGDDPAILRLFERGYMEYTCENCKYYEPVGDKRGECRVVPPVIVPTVKGAYWAFPISKDAAWCGKFESKIISIPEGSGVTRV